MSAQQRAASAPPRGTRPRNRRELIIAAAADLFLRRGYERVAMSDIAAAVNVRPSALYRHFAGKPELLSAVLLAELEPFRQAMTADASDTVLTQLVDRTLDHPGLGVLWQRESRALEVDEREVVRDELRGLSGRLATILLRERPSLHPTDAELLSWSAWAVLHSVGHHSVDLPRDEYSQLLELILRSVVAVSPEQTADGPPQSAASFTPQARREKLLAAAVPLFAAHGYAGVSMEDIGARAGITGPSVYRHYESKQEILYAALVRGDEWLRYDMHQALAPAVDTEDALWCLIESYVDFAAANSSLIDLLISELRHLPDGQRTRLAQSQNDYLDEWLLLLARLRPERAPMQSRARTHAALSVVNDIARTKHLRERPGTLATVKRLVARILLDD